MKVTNYKNIETKSIELFESKGAFSKIIGDGSGDTHIYYIYFEPNGIIGKHVAGFDQLLIVVEGEGWAEGGEGRRENLSKGQVAFIKKGEIHAKGSYSRMIAIMIQVDEIDAESFVANSPATFST
ncbi:MAG: hypothetical protein AB7H86_03235 [Blastocatellales bacterium]